MHTHLFQFIKYGSNSSNPTPRLYIHQYVIPVCIHGFDFRVLDSSYINYPGKVPEQELLKFFKTVPAY